MMLAHLPEELLLDIICRLQVDRDAHYTESNPPTAESRYRETKASIATLAALSLTCRVFNRLCTTPLDPDQHKHVYRRLWMPEWVHDSGPG